MICQERAAQSSSPAWEAEPEAPPAPPPAAKTERVVVGLETLLARRAAVKRWADKNRGRLKEYSKKRWQQHGERLREQSRIYMRSHKKEYAALAKAWREKNRDHRREYNRKWREKNPHKIKTYNTRNRFVRRTRDRAADVNDRFVGAIIERWRKEPEFTCYYCQERFDLSRMQVDHIIPVSKGGKHTSSNVCRSCDDCNHRKRAHLVCDFWPKNQGLLSL